MKYIIVLIIVVCNSVLGQVPAPGAPSNWNKNPNNVYFSSWNSFCGHMQDCRDCHGDRSVRLNKDKLFERFNAEIDRYFAAAKASETLPMRGFVWNKDITVPNAMQRKQGQMPDSYWPAGKPPKDRNHDGLVDEEWVKANPDKLKGDEKLFFQIAPTNSFNNLPPASGGLPPASGGLPPASGEFPNGGGEFPNGGGGFPNGGGMTPTPSPVVVSPPLPSLKERKIEVDLIMELINKRVAKLIKEASSGDAKAQFSLGQLYESGVGVPLSFRKSFDLYKKSAEGGNVYAQYALGRAYSIGQGVRTDRIQAYMWLSVAASKGFSFINGGKMVTAAQERYKIAKSMSRQEIKKAQSFSVGFSRMEDDQAYLNALRSLTKAGKRREALELIKRRHQNKIKY